MDFDDLPDDIGLGLSNVLYCQRQQHRLGKRAAVAHMTLALLKGVRHSLWRVSHVTYTDLALAGRLERVACIMTQGDEAPEPKLIFRESRRVRAEFAAHDLNHEPEHMGRVMHRVLVRTGLQQGQEGGVQGH